MTDQEARVRHITGISADIGMDVTATDVPARVRLIDVGFHDERDDTHVRLSLVWDRERRVFDFAGDTELCTPAARQFFEEFGRRAMDYLKEYL